VHLVARGIFIDNFSPKPKAVISQLELLNLMPSNLKQASAGNVGQLAVNNAGEYDKSSRTIVDYVG